MPTTSRSVEAKLVVSIRRVDMCAKDYSLFKYVLNPLNLLFMAIIGQAICSRLSL